MIEALKPQHRPHSLFHTTVVLFNHDCLNSGSSSQGVLRAGSFFLEFAHRHMGGGIAVQRDLLGDASLLDRLLKEALGRRNIAVFAQEKVDGLSFPIHRAVQVDPSSFDPNVRFIDRHEDPPVRCKRCQRFANSGT